ncbi:MAG: EpsG family protein [Psychroflexus halocasei]
MGFGLLSFVLLYIGLRPIHGVFVDMTTYARGFERVQSGEKFDFKDPFFGLFLELSTRIMTVNTYFFVCAMIYILPLYYLSKKWFKSYWFYSFLLLVGSFSFFAYGTNGIRNGMATSLFLLGLAQNKKLNQFIWFGIALGMHFSMVLPLLAFIISQYYNKPKKFIIFWLISIPISLVGGKYWSTIFAKLSLFEDKRLNYFTDDTYSSSFSSSGFRWDFLIYSAIPIIIGWFYIEKCKYKDAFYQNIFITYLISNTFWILVIQASFSNRFAYLSWFMMAIVMIYPLLKQRLLKNQHKKIGILTLIYFSFTYLMWV